MGKLQEARKLGTLDNGGEEREDHIFIALILKTLVSLF